MTVEGGRIAKIDGSHRNPLTGGYICAKVRRYADRVYSPLRVLHPQRRVGRKGEGRFERISWDAALAEIAERFRGIIAADGAEAILPYHYGGSNGLFGEGAADARFFHRLGASELGKTLCAAPTGTAYQAMYGDMGGVPPGDFRLARALVLWGVNPSATSIHLVPEIRAAQRSGAFVAVVDPRRTPLARAADLHLQPLPGTDVVLALAVIDHLVRKGLADLDFIERHTNGFPALARAAAGYPVSRAAEICGVRAADVERLAETYAQATPALVRCGWGVERNQNGGNAVRAILALPAVAGKFGVRGGGITMSLSRAYPLNRTALARPDLRRRPVRQINMTQLGRVLTEAEYRVRALFVYNANPVAMTPNQGLVLRGLAREDLFTVVHEQMMTDTARFADLLLPAQTVFEHEELHKSYGHYVLQHSAPVIAPVGEALSNPEMFARLSVAMGFDEPELQADASALLEAALECDRTRLGGADAESLRRDKAVSLRFGGSEDLIPFVNELPRTASGRVELHPNELGRIEYRAVASTYPLSLLSPASSATINSIFGERRTRARLEIHPADASARGLVDGDVVRVYNELGEVQVTVKTAADVRTGVVCLPKGLWRASTLNGFTATALAPDHLSDIGGGACFNDARVEVERVAPS